MDDAGGLHGISPGVPTLAEALRERGYDTAAFTTNAWLTTPLGYSRGFDTWGHADERFHHMLAATGFPKGAKAREAERVVDRAIDWLEGEEADGFFLWVHLLDPHLPYAHAEGKLERGLSDESLRAGLRLDASVVERVKAAYQREVDYADAQLMRLLDALEAKGVLDRGLVVLTADHGEELWDHGATGHGHTHHREVVQIPLVLAGRGVVRGPAPAMVSLLDVPSTLALAAGASLGAGRDLRAPGSVDRVVTSQGNAYFHAQRSAWSMGRRAMLLTAAQDAPERCYDLNADPGEHTPVPCAPGSPALEAARAERAPSAEADAAELSREALKALGYVN
jgi:arylsulfatase A-like enzyme